MNKTIFVIFIILLVVILISAPIIIAGVFDNYHIQKQAISTKPPDPHRHSAEVNSHNVQTEPIISPISEIEGEINATSDPINRVQISEKENSIITNKDKTKVKEKTINIPEPAVSEEKADDENEPAAVIVFEPTDQYQIEPDACIEKKTENQQNSPEAGILDSSSEPSDKMNSVESVIAMEELEQNSCIKNKPPDLDMLSGIENSDKDSAHKESEQSEGSEEINQGEMKISPNTTDDEGQGPLLADWIEEKIALYKDELKSEDLKDFRIIMAKLDQDRIYELAIDGLEIEEQETLKKHMSKRLTKQEKERSLELFYLYSFILEEL